MILNTILLISSSLVHVLAARIVSMPFTAVDRKGIRAASNGEPGEVVEVSLRNIDLAYLVDLHIGTPQQPFTLLLDTGSSSTWIPMMGCGRYCGYPKNTFDSLSSSTYRSEDRLFSIKYGVGFSRGYYAQDTITINNVSVPDVNFALSDYNDGELTADNADGILGLGPDALTVYNNPEHKVIPTLVTTMSEKGIIDHNIFSVYFQPVNKQSFEEKRVNGELVFGGGRYYIQ
ncbi:aspartic peptidase domain-containing protein [Pilobolus umbonatus]|nr:aspartic peptidase domain-containing protein [Pilobolus umbonatus]